MNSLGCCTAVAVLGILCSYRGLGQTLTSNADLPDSPGAAIQAALPQAALPQAAAANTRGTAKVEGIVQNVQGTPLPDAKVTLTAPGKIGEWTAVTGSDGSFSFTDLPAGAYHLTIPGSEYEAYQSPQFAVKSGEAVAVPKIALMLATASSVTVTASSDQVAIEQVQEQEKQRVIGVFQNFYTSYIWKAEPMPARQKYKLAFRTIGDPTTFLIIAGIAGAEHYNGTYPGYGPGIEGYGKRYGAALADSVTGRIIGSAILPSLLHQDPRYFYQGSGGVPSRACHAVVSAVFTRGDNGRAQPNYSHLLGNLAAGGIANAYHPDSSRGLGLTFQTLGVTTGANAIGNLFREFLLRKLEPSVPSFANGK